MSDLYEGICNANDGLELIIPTSFQEALTYAQQILWLYYNKQSELVEGENITLTDNSDGTTTISCTLVENPGIKTIVGIVGPTGTQVVVTLTDDTTQSFFVERGPAGPAGAQGETGPAGADGRDGVDGQAATIAVGSVTTGQPGTSASVVNSGTSSAAVLDFTIPAGADGQPGAAGQNGQDGQAATIAVGSVTTGQPGTSATVVNSGTSSAAVLDFTIPAGADGQPGQTGPAGPGVPTGGTQGQVLTKNSSTDYDTAWGDVNEVPSTGTTGYVLTKTADGYDWAQPSVSDTNQISQGSATVDIGNSTDTWLVSAYFFPYLGTYRSTAQFIFRFVVQSLTIDGENFYDYGTNSFKFYDCQFYAVYFNRTFTNDYHPIQGHMIYNADKSKKYVLTMTLGINSTNGQNCRVNIPFYTLYDVVNNTFVTPTSISVNFTLSNSYHRY